MSAPLRVDVTGMAPGDLRAVEAGEERVLVCRTSDGFYAIENRCPHIQIPLDGGRLTGCVLECPLHGGKLDVRDGSDLALPIRRRARTFHVTPVDGGVEIDLTISNVAGETRVLGTATVRL